MAVRRCIVIGLDGLEPRLVESMLEAGELPHLARLRQQGGYGRIGTTYPAQTPVAWSTFATGRNPGAHGLFDFLRRDCGTYLPQLSFSRFEQKNPFVPPKVVNLRRGRTVWQILSEAGVPAVVIRCPCSYPPEPHRGRTLAGMGVPDLRGGLGTGTFYTSDPAIRAGEGESVVHVRPEADGTINTHLLGPLGTKSHAPTPLDITIELNADRRQVVVRSPGAPSALVVPERRWSDWLRVSFRTGLWQSVRGMVRFYLAGVEPTLALYASPVNFDPDAPPFPIAAPAGYAGELMQALGTFHTTGMPEDHGALSNGRIDEAAYLAQCDDVYREREAMLWYELDRLREGLLFCLFDTPDRVQHMFWRFREPDHPANAAGASTGFERVIEDYYRKCDATIGRVLEAADDETLVIVLSDHGFTSFRRGVHLNTWLHDQGLLALKDGTRPGDDGGDLLRHVDWSRTKAYALGLGGIYLNRQGREGQGIVAPDECSQLQADIARALAGLVDPERDAVAVRRVLPREEVFRGPCADEAPDLLVNFAAGYRASWGTALGDVRSGLFEDNTRRWAGDHIVDPELVPGVLFMNRGFRGESARLLDMAPTILAAFGVPREPAMEGESLLR